MKRILFIYIFLALSFSCSIYAQETEKETKKKDYFKPSFGLSYNVYKNFLEDSNNKGSDTQMGLDYWSLGFDSQYSGIDLSFQYRFYSSAKTHFIYYGYMGYQANDNIYAKVGVFRKPFGLDPYAANTWYYQLPYYIGLEDDQDLGGGITYTTDNKKLKFDLAYFRQAEPNGPVPDNTTDNDVGNGRYTYDIVPTTGIADGEILPSSIQERNQFNARVLYKVANNIELGGSLQLGGIYNSVLDKTKYGLTTALHADATFDKLNLKGQVISYDYNAQANNGKKLDVVQMAAYGYNQDVAAKGMLYSIGLSYDIPINKGILHNIKPYIDYAYLDKNKAGYASTQQFTPGCMFTFGPVLLYVDYAMGKNHPALTSRDNSGLNGTGLGTGDKDAKWNKVFHMNIGYYF